MLRERFGDQGRARRLQATSDAATKSRDDMLSAMKETHGERWTDTESSIKRLEAKAEKSPDKFTEKDRTALINAHHTRLEMMGGREADFAKAEAEAKRAAGELAAHREAMLASRGITLPDAAEPAAKGAAKKGKGWTGQVSNWISRNPLPAAGAAAGGGAVLGGVMFGHGGGHERQ